MGVSFSAKNDRKELGAVETKLAEARKEITGLRQELNDARSSSADSNAKKEAARAGEAEAALAQHESELAKTTAAVRRANADNLRLRTKAALVEGSVHKAFDQIVKSFLTNLVNS